MRLIARLLSKEVCLKNKYCKFFHQKLLHLKFNFLIDKIANQLLLLKFFDSRKNIEILLCMKNILFSQNFFSFEYIH
jgi:hypothetical protein